MAESFAGTVVGVVDDRSSRVLRCQFDPHPMDENGWLLPLWVVFPDYTSVTIHWRMGAGEHYRDLWNRWWDSLSREQREKYRETYPEPSDPWLASWEGFYVNRMQ